MGRKSDLKVGDRVRGYDPWMEKEYVGTVEDLLSKQFTIHPDGTHFCVRQFFFYTDKWEILPCNEPETTPDEDETPLECGGSVPSIVSEEEFLQALGRLERKRIRREAETTLLNGLAGSDEKSIT